MLLYNIDETPIVLQCRTLHNVSVYKYHVCSAHGHADEHDLESDHEEGLERERMAAFACDARHDDVRTRSHERTVATEARPKAQRPRQTLDGQAELWVAGELLYHGNHRRGVRDVVKEGRHDGADPRHEHDRDNLPVILVDALDDLNEKALDSSEKSFVRRFIYE